MSVEIAWKQNILVTDFHLLKSLLVVLGFGSQVFVCGFSRQNINSVYNYRPSGQHTKKPCDNVTKHCKERDAGKQVVIILNPTCTYLNLHCFFKPFPKDLHRINNVFDVEGNTGQLPTRYRVANLLLYWELMVAVPFILQ